MPNLRILVTGGRDYTDRAAVTRALRHLGANYIFGFRPDDVVLIHGAATGADTLAAEEAVRLGWKVEPHPADWKQYGAAAGPIRNNHMVELGAHYCLAFPGGEGTKNCRRLALNAHIPVIDIPEGHHG